MYKISQFEPKISEKNRINKRAIKMTENIN